MSTNKNNKREEIITIIYLMLWILFVLGLAYVLFSIFDK